MLIKVGIGESERSREEKVNREKKMDFFSGGTSKEKEREFEY